jgi:hypothetical protein
MSRTAGLTAQILLSTCLSIAASMALTFLLKLVLSAASGPKPDGHPEGGNRDRPGNVNINPVAVFVLVPVLVKNQFGARRIEPRSRKGWLRR